MGEGRARERRMQCMQVWGGNETAETSVVTTGLDVWLYSKPMGKYDSGGDIYYLSACSSGRITRLVLADVCGHGQQVAGLARVLRDEMRRHINHVNQRALVRALNRSFARIGNSGAFATGLVVSFFLPTTTLTVSNAGHAPPLIFDSVSGTWREILQPSARGVADVPLGIFEHATYSQVALTLARADVLVGFTDGVTECVDARGEMLGRDGLRDLVSTLDPRQPQLLIPAILQRLRTQSSDRATDDDVSIVVARRNDATVSLRDNVLAPVRALVGLTHRWRTSA